MTIRTSAAAQIEALVADLSSDRPTVREAAVARLAVIGARAVPRLVALARSPAAPRVARVAALRALEGLDDTRVIDAALALVDDDEPEVAVAAIAVARAGFGGPRGTSAIDRLASVATETHRTFAVREAAFQALSDLEPATLRPLVDVLSGDDQAAIRTLAQRIGRGEARDTGDAAARIAAAAAGDLPGEPDVLRRAIVQAGAVAPLPDLRQVIDVVRERETSVAPSKRPLWQGVRGAAHAALARRRSRLALVDLRETLETSSAALPVDFVAALVEAGDASCLDAIAAAWERANAHGERDAWWQRHLADAFQAIVARERLTRRHAVLKRLEKRWPAASAALRGRPPRQ